VPDAAAAGAASVPAADSTFDFDRERAVVAAAEAKGAATAAPPAALPDPWAPHLADHGAIDGGLAAALARANGSASGEKEAVAARVAALRQITAMGFPPATAAAALELGGGDVQAATDACLAAGQ
jgi:hypothetical protein